jgi:hypothetical protein
MFLFVLPPARAAGHLPLNTQRLLIEKAQVLTTNAHAGEPFQGKYRLLRSLHLSLHGTAYRIIHQIFH